jgi:hypothetical protein
MSHSLSSTIDSTVIRNPSKAAKGPISVYTIIYAVYKLGDNPNSWRRSFIRVAIRLAKGGIPQSPNHVPVIVSETTKKPRFHSGELNTIAHKGIALSI